MSKTEPSLVDGVGREDVRISGHHLVRLGALIALVERTAVRNAAEDARNKDRIVGEAVACEDLVLVGGVYVAADIELVPVLKQSWAIGICLQAGIWRREQIQDGDGIRVDSAGGKLI